MLTLRRKSSKRILLFPFQARTRGRFVSNLYPYPQTKNPTPHQIFHLPQNASKADIKSRYFELVRIHHPDSALVRAQRIPEEVAHTRFQTISAAYDKLRGKKPLGDEDSIPEPSMRPSAPGLGRNRPDLQPSGDDRWKDRLILAGVILAFGGFFLQNNFTRRQAIEEAATRARQSRQAKNDTRRDETLLGVTQVHKQEERSLSKS